MTFINKEKLIQVIDSFILIFFFVLPFERIPTFEAFGFTVKISYIVGLLLIIFLFFCKKYFAQFLKKSPTIPDYSLFVLLGAGILSLFASKDLKRSVVVLSLWLFMFLIYYLLSRILTRRIILEKIESIIIAVSVLVCMFGIFQFVGDYFGLAGSVTGLRERYTKEVLGFTRIQSVALEPLYFACYLLVPIFIAIKKYINKWSEEGNFLNRIFNKYFWVLLLFLTTFILTSSRGAYIGLFVSSLILISYYFFNVNKRNFKLTFYPVGSLLVIFLLSVLCSFVFITSTTKSASNFAAHVIANDSSNTVSVNGRLEGYKTAIEKFKSSPIIGVGVGTSGLLNTPVIDHNEILTYGSLNNLYLEILAECGLIGFVAFLIFLLFYFIEFLQHIRELETSRRFAAMTLFCGLLAIFIQYNFFSTLYIIYIWAFLALLRGEMYAEDK